MTIKSIREHLVTLRIKGQSKDFKGRNFFITPNAICQWLKPQRASRETAHHMTEHDFDTIMKTVHKTGKKAATLVIGYGFDCAGTIGHHMNPREVDAPDSIEIIDADITPKAYKIFNEELEK